VFIRVQILPTQGMTAAERAEAISAELFAISRPPQVRAAKDVSRYLFGWVKHPTDDVAVLQAQTDYVIRVHPDNNISGLVALFPDLSEQERDGLTAFIQSSQFFEFGQILPSNSTIISDEEFNSNYLNHGEL
jgi:hypothetical protein